MSHFWLITEPARGTSVQIIVPENVEPEAAFEHWAETMQQTGELLAAWRDGDQADRFSDVYSEEAGEDVQLVETTMVVGQTLEGRVVSRLLAVLRDAVKLPDVAVALARTGQLAAALAIITNTETILGLQPEDKRNEP